MIVLVKRLHHLLDAAAAAAIPIYHTSFAANGERQSLAGAEEKSERGKNERICSNLLSFFGQS